MAARHCIRMASLLSAMKTDLIAACWRLADFIADRRPHGSLTADATPPAWNGYLLTVACPCGAVFEWWVTPGDAELNLLRVAQMN
jgi:hypothetical protein